MKRSLVLFPVFVLLCVWLGYVLLAHPVSRAVAHHWGSRILLAGDGAFQDPAGFVQHRLFDAAFLLTGAVTITGVVLVVGGVCARRLPPVWHWVPYSAAGFLGLNVWLKLAAGSCLFWCLFWNGKEHTNNLTQFHIKRLLLEKNSAPVKVVLGGSSQVRAQIDQRLLNRRFGTNLFVTQLHFPGSHAYDFLFLEHELAGSQTDIIVCYLSELNFFTGGISDGFSLFFTAGDLGEFLRLGGRPQWAWRQFGYGLLGSALPVFRLRDPITERLLGGDLPWQRQPKPASMAELERRARETAPLYRADEQSQFGMAAFEAFVAQCRSRHVTVVLCCGQLHPLLARRLDPGLRPRMVKFLQQLAAKYDNTVLLDENALPAQTEADYDDLTHATKAAQTRYTEAIGELLRKMAASRRSADL